MSVDTAWLRGWIHGAAITTPGSAQALARLAVIETQSLAQAVRPTPDGDELLWWYHGCGSVAAMPEAPTGRHDCGYTDPWRPMLVGQL